MEILQLQQFDSGKGREIRGLHPVDGNFSLLTEGLDYSVNRVNKAVRIIPNDVRPQDYVFFINPGQGEMEKAIEAPHWRTVTDALDTILRYEVKTADGFELRTTPFFEINTKGVGYTKPAIKGRDLREADHYRVPKEVLYGERQMGLASEDDFSPKGEGDIIATSTYLIAHGVRTETYLAVEDIKRLYFRNELYSVDELKKMGVIVPVKEFKPQIAQRLVKCNVRVEEIKEHDASLAEKLFDRGYVAFCREHGEKTREDMVTQSCKYIASSVASLINVGFIHGYLHSSNISIVGEVLDLGTCTHYENCREELFLDDAGGMRAGHYKDMRDALTSASYFIEGYEGLGYGALERNEIADSMILSFKDALQEQETSRQGTDARRALEVFTTLCNLIIRNNRRVKSFKKGGVAVS